MEPQKCEGLHRFTEAHLVGQDSAEILLRERRQPGNASELIIAQLLTERAEAIGHVSGFDAIAQGLRRRR